MPPPPVGIESIDVLTAAELLVKRLQDL